MPQIESRRLKCRAMRPGDRQMPCEPGELLSYLLPDPIGTVVPVDVPGRTKEAALHAAVRVDERCNEPQIHDDTAQRRCRVTPLVAKQDERKNSRDAAFSS